MECSCEVDMDIDNGPDAFLKTTPKARKTHKCTECGRLIKKGEIYTKESGIWDDGPETYKTCSDCISLRDEFFTSGWLFGQIRCDLHDFIGECDGEISEDCIANLTKKAKGFVCDRIEYLWDDME